MALVWKYGERKGYESWKGLSWGMVRALSLFSSLYMISFSELFGWRMDCLSLVQVPLLGGALCACTWHFFYNDESLEVKNLLYSHFSYKTCFVFQNIWWTLKKWMRLSSCPTLIVVIASFRIYFTKKLCRMIICCNGVLHY